MRFADAILDAFFCECMRVDKRHSIRLSSSMTTSRASAAEADKSIEAKLSDDDAEMNDGVEEELSEIDAEGESVNGIEGGHDVLQSIKDLTNYLCKVEQECGKPTVTATSTYANANGTVVKSS